MALGEQVVGLANDYISGRIDLGTFGNWLMDHVEELAYLPDEDIGGQLSGFIQVRMFEIGDGVYSEPELRDDVRAFLSEHPSAARPRRSAAG